MTRIQELREKRAHISEELMKLSKSDMTPELRTRYDALTNEANDLAGDITRVEQAEALEAEMRATTRPPNDAIGELDEDELKKRGKRERKKQKKVEVAALRHWALTGTDPARLLKPNNVTVSELPKELREYIGKREKRDLGVGTQTSAITSSVFVPIGFVNDVDIALKAYGQLAANVRELATATGQPLPYPTSTDVANIAEYVGEGAQVTVQDVTLGNTLLQAWKADTKMVKVSLELLQDSAFNIEDFLRDAFAIRKARFMEQEFVTGTGAANSHITGLLSGVANASATLGTTAAGSSTNDGSTKDGTNSIGSQDLINLVAAVDPLYRQGAKFVVHDATWQALANTLDKYGRPLFLPNPQNGKLEAIYGYPLIYNQTMPQIAAAKNTVLFGDLSKYIYRNVKELAVIRLVERFADAGQVAFLAFFRCDGILIDAGQHPVKYLAQHA